MSPSSIAAEPYPDAHAHLRDHLARIARLLDRVIVSDLDLRIAAREDATRIALPLRVLRERAGLDERALQLLVLAAVPALDGELAGRLRERIAGTVPTVGELLAILDLPASKAGDLIAVLVRSAPLLAHGLVELSVDEATPLLERRLCVAPRVAAFLRGEGLFDHVPAANAQLGAARSAYRPVVVPAIGRPLGTPIGKLVAATAIPEATERQIAQILAAARLPGETIEAGFQRKEHELGELFATLTPLEARALHRRLSSASLGDVGEIGSLFSRLVPERRARLLAFLAGARRRYAHAGAH